MLLIAISLTANAKTVHDYGCRGDITIYVDEEKTLYHPFPNGVYVNPSSSWFLREGNSYAWSDVQEGFGAKIVSKDYSSCTLCGMWDNTDYLNLETLKLYCIGTKQSQDEEYVCYWNIIVKSRGTVSVSASPSGGTVEKGTKVYLTASISGSEIYYTTNGDIPNKNSTLYTSSGITINQTTTLKAIAYKSGYENRTGTWNYTVEEEVVVAEINAENFPDEYFRNYLLSQSYGSDGILTEDEIGWINYIYVYGSSDSPGNISSLKGIEYFTALKSLDCRYNKLITLDVSKNTALEYLDCRYNQLEVLDMSKNTALTSLSCDNNQLTFLDVSKSTALTGLHCDYNQLTSLDVSKNIALTSLSCNDNQLVSLTLSNALTSLNCHHNQLTALDVSENIALRNLYCHFNQLANLDLSKNTVLESLWCNDNQITTLDVTKDTALKYLYCRYNKLTSLDVTKNSALETLDFQYNDIIFIDLSNNTKLSRLFCNNNHLSSLDASNNPNLTFLRCSGNQIKGTDMDNLISSLPINNTSEIYEIQTVNPKDNDESNICTKAQVAIIKEKGWFPCYWDEQLQEYVEYEGIEVPESITLPSPITVSVGQTIKLTPTIMPSDATTTLTWSSDDETIATVDANGMVTGIKKGMTFVSVETNNGKTAYCKLTVTASEPTAISLPKNVTVSVGGTLTLVPTITPENAETTLTWTSDDESVARVSADGVLTGVAEGLALVTVSTANGLTSNACKVTVSPYLAGIVSIKKDENVSTPICTISGQRLMAPKKGINIVNGKKVVKK